MSEDSLPSPAFQRAFVAMSYLCGQRGEALHAPLGPGASEARKLANALALPDRQQRATVLGRELTRIADALSARAY